MAVFTVVSGPTVNTATGLGMQSCAFWDGTMLVVGLFSSTQSFTPYTSTDLTTYTARTALSLTAVHNSEGRNKDFRGKVISATTVGHLSHGFTSGSTVHRHYHSRVKFAGTTPTWAADTLIGTAYTTSLTSTVEGSGAGIDTNNKPVDLLQWTTVPASHFGGAQFPNADTGSAWTIGTAALSQFETTGITQSTYLAIHTSGMYNALGDNGAVTGTPTNVFWVFWNGTTGTAAGVNVFASSVSMNINDWGACVDSNNKSHVVRRTGSNTYEHRIGSISAGVNTFANGGSIPTQTSLGTSGGLAMMADNNGDVWLGVIDSAAGNAVKIIRYNGTSWDAAWTTLESSSATRTYLTAVPQVVNNQAIWLWTEGTGSPFAVKGEAFTIAHALAANVTSGASVTGALTVTHALAASATAGASVTGALTVKHPLTASATSGASVTGALTWHHAIKASATSGASVTAALTVKHPLAAAATAGASVSAALTVKHGIAASATAGASTTAALTVKHPLAASTLAGAAVTGALTVKHPLATSATSGAAITGALTVKHGLATSATSGASVSGALTVKHPLQASATAGASVSGLLTVTGGGASHALAAAATAGASVSAQLTVKHPLTTSATSGASTTGLLLVKHPLAASALSGASVTGHAAVTRKLSAAATSGAAVTAALTIQHRLSATIASSTTALGLLTWYHALYASVTSAATVSATPTVHLSAKIAPVGTFGAGTIPAAGIGAGIVPADSVAGGILPAGTSSAAVVPSGTIERG